MGNNYGNLTNKESASISNSATINNGGYQEERDLAFEPDESAVERHSGTLTNHGTLTNRAPKGCSAEGDLEVGEDAEDCARLNNRNGGQFDNRAGGELFNEGYLNPKPVAAVIEN